MKKIFKNSIYLFAGLLTLIATSCNDWLEVSPDTETDKSTLLKKESGYADALSGIYAKMCSDNLYGKNMTWYGLELMGGGAKAMYGTNANFMAFFFNPKASYYMESLRNQFTDPIWNEEYNAIANINSLLKDIDGNQGAFQGDDYKVYKGELLGLRAFLHFDVLRLFADAYTSADYSADKTYIPYVTDLTSNVHPLLTNDQVCELALKDLTEAKELLKSDPMYTNSDPSEYVCSAVSGSLSNRNKYGIKSWHNRRFHFNYYAVLGTMARIYLWKGDKTNALACAKEVIDAPEGTFTWVNPTLVSNTQRTDDYSARDRTFCTEQLFALNINDLPDRMDGYTISINKPWDGQTILGINSDVFDPMEKQYDLRYSYLKTGVAYQGSNYDVCTKYYKDDSNNSYFPWAANRLPLIRLGEMYLIAAECEPNLETATQYLTTLRSHRGLSSVPLTISSRDELQEAIRLEYHKEMFGEGQSFYYYKRLNLPLSNATAWSTYDIEPNVYTMPRPDDEDTYGGR